MNQFYNQLIWKRHGTNARFLPLSHIDNSATHLLARLQHVTMACCIRTAAPLPLTHKMPNCQNRLHVCTGYRARRDTSGRNPFRISLHYCECRRERTWARPHSKFTPPFHAHVHRADPFSSPFIASRSPSREIVSTFPSLETSRRHPSSRYVGVSALVRPRFPCVCIKTMAIPTQGLT